MTENTAKYVALFFLVAGTLVHAAFKPRTPEEFAAMPPRIAAVLKAWGAMFPDFPQLFDAIAQVFTGKVPGTLVYFRSSTSFPATPDPKDEEHAVPTLPEKK
jgi:hypothetical protein